MKTYINPTMLKWARERSAYPVSVIAEKLKKRVSEVESWETGKSSPTYYTLEKLAYQYYKVPLAIFYFPEPPKLESPKTKLRRLPHYELERLSPDTYHMINLGQGYQESLVQLLGPTNNEDAIFKLFKEEVKADIERFAGLVRKHLNITIRQQIGFESNEKALKAWRHSLEVAGLYTFKDSFEDKFISGFSLLHIEYPIIFLNNSNTHSRQIFTLIHELAHILFGVNGISDIDDHYYVMMSEREKNIERLCNQFAAELLLPLKVFSSEMSAIEEINDNSILKLASKYKVSREVILRRLKDIGSISIDDYAVYTEKWRRDYIRSKKGGGNYYLNKLAYVGEGFAKLAFSNYKAGRISNYELAQHLNMNSKNIPKLESYIRL